MDPQDSTSATEDRYWADKPCVVGDAHAQPEDGLADEIIERIRRFQDAVETNGMLALWQTTHAAYYGLSQDGSAHETSTVTFGGNFDERIYCRSNHFRSIIQYQVITATSDRPDLSPRALNSEATSLAQVPVARCVLEHYMREGGVERRLKSVVERGITYGYAFLWGSWDPTEGQLYAPTDPATGKVDESKAEYSGDIRVRAVSPHDVARDVTRGLDNLDWVAVREACGRHDLAARFAPLKSETSRALRDVLIHGDHALRADGTPAFGNSGFGGDVQSDDIDVWHFYHRRTDALPDGRYTMIVPGGAVLFDGPLPYDDLTVLPFNPSEMLETGFGYAGAWDLLALQDMYDSVLSTCMTNVDMFGVKNITAEEGSQITAEQISDGCNVLYYPAGTQPPQTLDLGGLDEGMFKLAELIKSDMQTLPGVNSVARGDPSSSLKSGAALALVQAQAVQYNSAFQAAYTQLLEATGTMIIRMLKRYAKYPRLAAIVGEHETDALREFKRDDLMAIDRVVCDIGNALQRTTSGKVQIAEWLMDKGLIKRPEQLFRVLDTGRLDPIYKADTAQLQCIAQENERMREGKPVMVYFTDNPMLHIQEHMAVMASHDVRTNPKIAEAVGAHIREHIKVWRNTDPDLLGAMGFPVPAAPPGPGGPEPDSDEAGGPDMDSDGDGAKGPPPPPSSNAAPPPIPGGRPGESGPRMPNMPRNPMEGMAP